MKIIYNAITIFFITLLLSTFSMIFYFKNSFIIIYNVYEELKTSNESVETLGELTNYYTTDDIDIKNIKYKDSLDKNVFLDIYRSNTYNNPSPVIIYVHGGSWVYGDNGIPTGLVPIINAFNKRGYTIISVSYELLKEDTPIENPIIDVKDAIRWVYKNSSKYNFDTENIGILGISSGAHLSLMACYSEEDEFIGDSELKGYPSDVKYILDVFGPIDLDTLNPSSIEKKYKKTIDNIINSKDIIEKYNPINHINSSDPNTLIIHSKNDEIVPYKNANLLYNTLISNGVDSKLLTLQSGSHYFNGYSKTEILALLFEILKFLDINNR